VRVLLGGFHVELHLVAYLNVRNRTGYQYFSPTLRQEPPERESETIIETAVDAPSEEVVEHAAKRAANRTTSVPMLNNYFFSALAGTTWYLQFFFYTMARPRWANYKFSSWTLHMASIIISVRCGGSRSGEWKGSSGFTKTLLFLGLLMLVFSTIVVGFGTTWARRPRRTERRLPSRLPETCLRITAARPRPLPRKRLPRRPSSTRPCLVTRLRSKQGLAELVPPSSERGCAKRQPTGSGYPWLLAVDLRWLERASPETQAASCLSSTNFILYA